VTEHDWIALYTLLQHLEVWVRLFRGEDAIVMQRDINRLKNTLGHHVERLRKLEDEPGYLYGND